ncbi:hypothetical protein LCGC14_2813510, partial [marine sediment metagenome]
MTAKIQKGCILTLFFLFTALVNITIVINIIDSDIVSDKIKVRDFENEDLKYSKISSRIHINNNWSDAKTAGIATGSGTYNNSYVIEDLIIDNGGFGHGILIENSVVYFRIENCTLLNSKWVGIGQAGGITLRDVQNGQLINNTSTYNSYGINIERGSNNEVLGNIVNDNLKGIYLSNSDNINMIGNTVNNNNYDGIFLYNGNYNNISGNKINNNGYQGISIDGLFGGGGGDYNTITANIANNNSGGIFIRWSNNNTVSGNTANNNNRGIIIIDSYYNTITENTANINTMIGIDLDNSDNITITENTVNYNNNTGIKLDISNYNTILGNEANDNLHFGIYVSFSDNNEISGNEANNNGLAGIFVGGIMMESYYNTISGNTLENNFDGIFLWNSYN